jgi:hypothetical protein
LKGGYAMELRIKAARTTKDIDLTMRSVFSSGGKKDDRKNLAVLEKLQEAAAFSDFFVYTIGEPISDLDAAPYGGARFPVEARVNGRVFVGFHLDVGIGDAVMEPLEVIEGRDWLGFAGIASPSLYGKRRIPFLSAMSMLGSKDNDTRSYLEIVDALRQHGAEPKADMKALWRRLVFDILISNTDDHLRNHGFLYAGREGWRLSPAYDLNSVPTDIKPRIPTTAINEDDNTASLALALDVAGYFELDATNARKIAAEVGNVVAKWRDEAARHGVSKAEIDRMMSAFEHEDLEMARRG